MAAMLWVRLRFWVSAIRKTTITACFSSLMLELAHLDVAALMHEDINEARARLGIKPPVIYRECLAQLKEEGFAEDSLDLSAKEVQPQAA